MFLHIEKLRFVLDFVGAELCVDYTPNNIITLHLSRQVKNGRRGMR
jgi:hypothetical protein